MGMMRFAASLSMVALAALLGACGDSGAETGGGGHGAGGDNPGGSAPGGGGSGTGGSAQCDAFIDPEPPVQTVDVTIQNTTANVIYLGAPTADCGTEPYFYVQSANGDPVKIVPGECGTTCSSLLTSGCGCALDCAQPQVVQVDPGGTYATTWTAIVYADVAMPAECYFDSGCVADTCPQAQLATGTLTFLSDGYPALADCQTGDCTCDGGAEGSCVVVGASSVSGQPATASTTWTPAAATIQIVFQ